MSIRKQYDDIAGIYDLLSEGDNGVMYFRMFADQTLKKLPGDARILDCSCGTGDNAIWMARKNKRVHASDISVNMLQQAKAKAEKAQVDIRFYRSAWNDLPNKTPGSYSCIFSPGNSFAHLDSMAMLEQSLSGIYRCLEKGGSFSFDLRNWEKTFAERNLKPQEFEAGRRGHKLRVSYAWDLKGWNKTCLMHVDTLNIKSSAYQKYLFDFFPVRYNQIQAAMRKAGFDNTERRYYPDDNYYFVTGHKQG